MDPVVLSSQRLCKRRVLPALRCNSSRWLQMCLVNAVAELAQLVHAAARLHVRVVPRPYRPHARWLVACRRNVRA